MVKNILFQRKNKNSIKSARYAQRINIMAARMVADSVRTTLGPKGMDKMLVDSFGNITVTNDGVTILKEMEIEHPSARMIAETAKTQESEVGDGTTTVVILAGELLKNAEILLDSGMHPSSIIKCYRIASEKANSIMESISERITDDDKEILRHIAMTAITGKNAEIAKDRLAWIAVESVSRIMEKSEGRNSVDLDNIKIERITGESAEKSELVQGVIINREKVNAAMPKSISMARIALIDAPIEIRETEIDAKIQITNPRQMQEFLDQEDRMILSVVNRIIKTGANVVFCQKGIDDIAHSILSRNNIYACRRVSQSDMRKLAKATGARIVSSIEELGKKDIGKAGIVEEKKIGDESMTFVSQCKNPKAVTILIRGSTEHIADEIKRAMDDALGDVAASLIDSKAVGGAGSAEIETAIMLRRFAGKLSGKEKDAVRMFADSMEIVPRTLAENSGIDADYAVKELRKRHIKGQKWSGINVFTGRPMDSWKNNVIEPLKLKTRAISSASDVASMILRIDSILVKGKKEDAESLNSSSLRKNI